MIRIACATEASGHSDQNLAVLARLEALQKWQKRGRGILPLIMKWLRR